MRGIENEVFIYFLNYKRSRSSLTKRKNVADMF